MTFTHRTIFLNKTIYTKLQHILIEEVVVGLSVNTGHTVLNKIIRTVFNKTIR